MTTYEFKAETIEEAQEYISGVDAHLLNNGDKALVTYPDGRKVSFILIEDYWEYKKDNDYILKPDNNSYVSKDDIDMYFLESKELEERVLNMPSLLEKSAKIIDKMYTFVLGHNEVECEMCHKIFIKGWTEKEARKEEMKNFGVNDPDAAIVCDSCYKMVMIHLRRVAY